MPVIGIDHGLAIMDGGRLVDVVALEAMLAAVDHELDRTRAAIRKHRDLWLAGDDKCWRDNEELYQVLPEGFKIPERDTLCEMANCERYTKSCHHPGITYVSPQRRIEDLENVLDAKREGGGETIGDTLIRLSAEQLTEDWRGWLRDHGARINKALATS